MESPDRLKARTLAPVSQVINAKEKFLKEYATPGNTGMVKKKKLKEPYC